jgi:hypothetical protein
LYWYSLATLAPAYQESFGGKFSVPISAEGWSTDKCESQTKAVIAAIERLACYRYAHNPSAAGLDRDATRSGFAAAPKTLGREFLVSRSFHEAIEKWLLNRLDEGSIALQEITLQTTLRKLFPRRGGRWRVFHAHLALPAHDVLPAGHADFVLSLWHDDDGGIVPGTACGRNFDETLERASLKTFKNLRRLKRIRDGLEQLLDTLPLQRLWNFATDAVSARRILRVLNSGKGESIKFNEEVVFAGDLAGPWEADTGVYRVVIANSMPFDHGSVDQFLL